VGDIAALARADRDRWPALPVPSARCYIGFAAGAVRSRPVPWRQLSVIPSSLHSFDGGNRWITSPRGVEHEGGCNCNCIAGRQKY